MDTALSARELLSRLSVADIRQRLAELDGERRALMTLLRAAARRERGLAAQPAGRREAADA